VYENNGGDKESGDFKMIEKSKLIIISGSPCVGKTTVADNLFCSYENSVHLDDDWVWRVNPFSFDDPRNDTIYENMSFVLSNYLSLNFDYVFLSSVRMIGGRETLLNKITAIDYKTIGFTLTCSEKTLAERFKQRGDAGEVSFKWLRKPPYPNDYVINTDGKTVEQIVDEMKSIIDMN
jgi:broad-specificity NMP kinase